MPADMSNYFGKKNPKEEPQKQQPNQPQNKSPNPRPNGGFGFNLAFAIPIVIIVLFLFAKPYVVIDEGESGIKVALGKYDPDALAPGLHFFIPIIQDIIVVDTRVRQIDYKSISERFDSKSGILLKAPIGVLDERGLPVGIELTVQYRLNSVNSPKTIATYGPSWEEKIINPVVRDVVRRVVGKYEAEALPVKRGEVANKINISIRNAISKLANEPVTMVDVRLREIVLPKKVKEQIERVQLAKQQVEQAKQEVEKQKQIAQKAQEEARGIAEAKKIQASGEAQARLIQAKAMAESNQRIAKSLTKSLLQLKQIEVQGQFNEALQANKDAKIFLTPGGSTPNIWIDAKDKKTRTSTNN